MIQQHFLMGSETEYSISGRSRCEGKECVGPEPLIGVLLEAARGEFRSMADLHSSGFFLEQGGRLYNEIHGHPEYATPEVMDPVQVAAYDKAGERILLQAGRRVERERPLDLSIWKANLGTVFPDRVTFGSHESYLCWARLQEVAPQMLPHLVSRTIYAGAGCLSAHGGGMGFELSQRARHMVCDVGEDTTGNRAIFCTRVRKVGDASAREGWTRVHLIAKDSQRCPFGVYLTFGTTGLLFWLMNQRRHVGKGLTLRKPVAAMRAISLDPWLHARVPLADGRQLSALEIQECYLTECERLVAAGDGPPWGAEVIRHWRQTLEDLTKDPMKLARRLDPYLKLYIYSHNLERAGCDWREFHKALAFLAHLRNRYSDVQVRAILTESANGLTNEDQAKFSEAMTEINSAGPGMMDRLRLVVRMQALEVKYHELGGLFDKLASVGDVESVVLASDDIERATWQPPQGGRAAFRGATIKARHGQPGWRCDWGRIFHPESRTLFDMHDPFAAEYAPIIVDNPARLTQ